MPAPAAGILPGAGVGTFSRNRIRAPGGRWATRLRPEGRPVGPAGEAWIRLGPVSVLTGQVTEHRSRAQDSAWESTHAVGLDNSGQEEVGRKDAERWSRWVEEVTPGEPWAGGSKWRCTPFSARCNERGCWKRRGRRRVSGDAADAVGGNAGGALRSAGSTAADAEQTVTCRGKALVLRRYEGRAPTPAIHKPL